MTTSGRRIEAVLEYLDSEDNDQRLLAAFELLFAGVDIQLLHDAHLTENHPGLS